MSVRAAVPAVLAMPSRRELLRLWILRLLSVFTILLIWGILAVFSTTVYQRIALERSPYDKFLRHLAFIALGLGASGCLIAASRLFSFDRTQVRGISRLFLRFLSRFGSPRVQASRWIAGMYVFSLVLVAMVTLTAFGESYGGATLTLRLWGVGFQPSELMKITTVLYLAMLLCWWRDVAQIDAQGERRRATGFGAWLRDLFQRRDARADCPVWPDLPRRAVLVLLLPVFFTVTQKDMGNASLILGMGVITILLAGVDWRQLAITAVLLLLLGTAGVFLKPEYVEHAHSRLAVYWALLHNRQVDQNNEGFQITQSRAALALGGLTGRGYLNSEQKMHRLPVATKDFVFPIVVEESGFIGGVAVILLFLALAWCGINLANACIDPFNRSVIGALGLGLCMQAFANIGTTTGTLPVTGITLPFFSEGGTSIVVSTVAIGIMLALALTELRSGELRPSAR